MLTDVLIVGATMAETGSDSPRTAVNEALLNKQWEKQQQKTFTAWVNSHLRKVGEKVENVQNDFCDGRKLIALMEVVGDAQLPKPEKLNMRIHKVENVLKALRFIKEKGVNLVGIGADEIVDGNLKMILGMLWTLILRFEIQDISLEEMTAKDALLLWCQRKTHGYKGVDIQNFHMSWKDGLGFCALIHRHRPELINFDALKKDDPRTTWKVALETADKHLDIPPMLDVEDMVTCVKPDERSIMTYVAAYYKAFASSSKSEQAAKKIAHVLNMNRDHERLIKEYETMASDLLEWIPKAIAALDERPVLGSIEQCQDQFGVLNKYLSEEYPPRLTQKGDLEAHFSTLQTKLRLSGRPPYVPSEGKLVADINAAWGGLESSEAQKKEFLRNELVRCQQAEVKAQMFNDKANAHESWTNGKDALLSTDDYSQQNLGGIVALKKRHEAFQTDLAAHEARVHAIGTLANELDELRYAKVEEVNNRYASIYDFWQSLVGLTAQRQAALDQAEVVQVQLDALRLQFAKQAGPLLNFLEIAKEKLSERFVANTVQDAETLRAGFEEFTAAINERVGDYQALLDLDAQMKSLGSSENPYTDHSGEGVTQQWEEVQALIPVRSQQLTDEASLQASREDLRKQWAEQANVVSEYINDQQGKMKSVTDAIDFKTLEDQVQSLQSIESEVAQYKPTFDSLEGLNQQVQDALILDNPHSKLTIEFMRGKYHFLSSAIKRHINEFHNQILTRDSRNITEDQMREYRESFKHFDKNHNGKLDRLEFRACLISLGYDLPQHVKEGEADPEFDRVWLRVDPNKNGVVDFDEFVSFMAEEAADAETSDQLLQAFKLLAQDKPYVTVDQLRRDLSPELAEYCISFMQPYSGGPEGALDYQTFAAAVYGESQM